MGAGGLATADMVLNIGPQHPATHGVLRLRIVVDGERIVSAEPIVGYMHRGAEKLFEVRDYRQIIVLANRHDWLSAFSNELGVVLGVEQMLGMEVPERAVWARTLLAELNRVLNHLMFLGSYPLELGAITPIFYAFREREELQAVMEEVSGGRMHYMFNRVGGLKEDLPAGWLGRVAAAIAAVRRRLPDLESLIVGNEILQARTRGVGVLSPATVAAYGVSGPIARACGVDLDLRRDEPYLAYAELFDGRRPGPGRDPHRRRLPGAARGAARAGPRQPRPRRGLPRPAGRPAAGADQRQAAQGAAGARGRPLHARPRTRSASTATTSSRAGRRRRGGSSCARRRSTTSRCSLRCCRATSSPTWSRSSARCSSSSATSTSSRRPPAPVPGQAAVSRVALLLDLAPAALVEPGPPAPHADGGQDRQHAHHGGGDRAVAADLRSPAARPAARRAPVATGRCERGAITPVIAGSRRPGSGRTAVAVAAPGAGRAGPSARVGRVVVDAAHRLHEQAGRDISAPLTHTARERSIGRAHRVHVGVGQQDERLRGVPAGDQRPGERRGLGEHQRAHRPQRAERPGRLAAQEPAHRQPGAADAGRHEHDSTAPTHEAPGSAAGR